MSTPPSAPFPPHSKSRKKRSADVVSFEDLLAAHKTERRPGQLPQEGVVLIGVDLELQRRMAERIGLPTGAEIQPGSPAPNIGAPTFISEIVGAVMAGALTISAPQIGTTEPTGAPTPNVSIDEHPSIDERSLEVEPDQIPGAPDVAAPNSGAP